MKKPLTGSQAVIYVDGMRFRHEYKSGGYFTAADVPEGEHTVEIRSPIFQTETVGVNVDYSKSVSAERLVSHIMLNPSPTHPSVKTMASVTGRVKGAHELYILRSADISKIAEDSAEKGGRAVKLFCGGAKPQLPQVFLIKSKSAAKDELIRITDSDGDTYYLAEPLKNSHARSSEVIPLVRIRCEEDGTFFFAVPPDFRADKDGNITLSAVCGGEGKLYRTELSAKSGRCTDLGNFDMKES